MGGVLPTQDNLQMTDVGLIGRDTAVGPTDNLSRRLNAAEVRSLIGSLTQSQIEALIAASVAALVDSSPGTLDTLNELAAALGDDPNFAATTAAAIAAKYTKPGTGIPSTDLSSAVQALLTLAGTALQSLPSHNHDDLYLRDSEIAAAFAAISHGHAIADVTGLQTALDAKQATLLSGTNLKTVNGSSLLGSGDLTISGGSGSSLAVNPGYRTNYYYSAFPCIAPSTLSLANNRIHYIPFQVAESVTFTRIGINVTTLQAASVIRLGIYNSSGGKPSTLLVDAGTVAGTSTGEKEITISQALTPGWYWLACLSDVNSIGVTAENGASSGDTVRCNLGTSTGAGNGIVYVYESFSYAALPASAGTILDMTGASNPPRIWLRKV